MTYTKASNCPSHGVTGESPAPLVLLLVGGTTPSDSGLIICKVSPRLGALLTCGVPCGCEAGVGGVGTDDTGLVAGGGGGGVAARVLS